MPTSSRAQNSSSSPTQSVLVASEGAAPTTPAAAPAAAAAAAAAATPAQAPPADDLDALKKRVEVLEADLKARQVVQPGDEDPNTMKEPIAPFSDGDWTWLQGSPHNHDEPLATKHFVPEIRVDTNYNLDFNHPEDDTISGSSEIFRSQEFQVEQLGLGGDFYLSNVHARFMSQFGLYSVTTPRNDASVSRGGWNLDNAYRYMAEMYGGYHINKLHGWNFDAGIFMSYIGLYGYYNFDNWSYQPSFVSSNTPWFFTGLRFQFFPTPHLKIEPWFINGWQTYGRFNSKPGMGGQIKYTHGSWFNAISNNYGMGEDDEGQPDRARIHTDNSEEFKFFERPTKFVDREAISITYDAGCEFGKSAALVSGTQLGQPSAIGITYPQGVSCFHTGHQANGSNPGAYPTLNPKQSFIGYMLYERTWFNHDRQALTFGGGQINNPGRYLVLTPIINEATALNESPYFSQNPGDPYVATDGTVTFTYMPRQFITYLLEYGYRHANVPYWNGRKGMTPPGANTQTPVGASGDYVCTNGSASFDSGVGLGIASPNTTVNGYANPGSVASNPLGETIYSAAQSKVDQVAMNNPKVPYSCPAISGGADYLWQPDLRKDEQKLVFAIMVKF
ncbi:MAG: outer membrane beta-barrel protein [Acidobacteriaceae bacterium]